MPQWQSQRFSSSKHVLREFYLNFTQTHIFGCSWTHVQENILTENTQTSALKDWKHLFISSALTLCSWVAHWPNMELKQASYNQRLPCHCPFFLFVQYTGYSGVLLHGWHYNVLQKPHLHCSTDNKHFWNCQCINFPSQPYVHYCQILSFRGGGQIQPFHTEN